MIIQRQHQTIYNWKPHITYTCTLASSKEQYLSNPCTNTRKKYYTHEDRLFPSVLLNLQKENLKNMKLEYVGNLL
jgi:hypothetical protein